MPTQVTSSTLERTALRSSGAADKIRVGILRDYPEENWPSMDLCAEVLHQKLVAEHANELSASLLCPPFRRRMGRVPVIGPCRVALNADRFLNRFVDFPRWLAQDERDVDLYHVVDHSYAHLVHSLPVERTVITCNDLDTFRCLLEPDGEPRSLAYRLMTKRILGGLQKAARVTCISSATRDALLARQLVSPERVVVIHLGVDSIFSPNPDPLADRKINRLLGSSVSSCIELLHVGSTIGRKRIDVLLRVFSAIRKRFASARLIRVGGPFSSEQRALVQRLGLEDAIDVLPFITRQELAAVYRRSALLLQTSQSEGFGLPVVEALACGTPVVASDIAVLREVGGMAVRYRPTGDVPAWCESISQLLDERRSHPDRWARRRVAGLIRAAKFSWKEYAMRMVDVYFDVWHSYRLSQSQR